MAFATTRSVKWAATCLLLLSIGLYALGIYYYSIFAWAPWLTAAAEAAMVGAFADWFAVTVLFRHPLGIPIPHTAIIPRNQGRIAGTLARFIQENFLTPQALQTRLHAAELGVRLMRWLSKSENAATVAAQCKDVVRALLSSMQDQAISRTLLELLKDGATKTKLAPLISELLFAVRESDKEGRFFDEILSTVEKVLITHRAVINELIGRELPWYIPTFIKSQIYGQVTDSISKTVAAMRTNPNHLLRLQLAELISKAMRGLRTDSAWEAKLQRMLKEVMQQPALTEYLGRLRCQLLALVEKDPGNLLQDSLQGMLESAGTTLAADPILCQGLNEAISKGVLRLVQDYKAHAGDFIEHTVKGWDSSLLVEKIEQEVGRDLQFIRINGTLVGGCIGLLLHAITVIFKT